VHKIRNNGSANERISPSFPMPRLIPDWDERHTSIPTGERSIRMEQVEKGQKKGQKRVEKGADARCG
jgi:hypothetical protein